MTSILDAQQQKTSGHPYAHVGIMFSGSVGVCGTLNTSNHRDGDTSPYHHGKRGPRATALYASVSSMQRPIIFLPVIILKVWI